MSSPSVQTETGPIERSRSVDEPFVAPDQLSKDATRTDLACSSSLAPQYRSVAKAQPVLRNSSSTGSPACRQDNGVNDPHEVPDRVVLYLAGSQDDEDDRHRRCPSTDPGRAIVDWLAMTGPTASGPSSQLGRTSSPPSTSPPGKRIVKVAPSLPPSPSSSVLEAFVDKVLGPEFAQKGPCHSKSTYNTEPAAGRARCDRCRSRKLKCVIVSKTGTGASCSNCRRAHLACTRDQMRVSGNQTRVPRPTSKQGPTRTVNRTSSDHGASRTTRFSGDLEVPIKSDSIDCGDELPRRTTRSSLAQVSDQDKGKLDGYTVGLLKDVMHALERVKGSLGESTALPALVPTLTLLEEGFDSMPRLVSEPMLSTVCTMLQRIKVQCLRKVRLQNQVEIKSAVWYTQTLVDRTLSCIRTLIDIE